MKTYTSNLTSKPYWLGTYSDQTGKVLDVDYGFGPDGMYFIGDAGSTAYSVRTNWNISGHQVCEVIFTVDHSNFCTDQGICFYNDGMSPNWNWQPDPSRIAFSINCPTPHIYGTNKYVNAIGEFYNGSGPEEGVEVLTTGTYTFKVTYNPVARTVTAVTYEGSDTNGNVVDTLVLHEKLMDGGPYRIGFDADNDGGPDTGEGSFPAYFKSLTINIYETNGISDDTDLNNQLENLKNGYSQITELVEGELFYFSDDSGNTDDGSSVGDVIDPNLDQLGMGQVSFIQSDGKVVIGGLSGLNDGSKSLRRINIDGTEDSEFMPPVFNDFIRGIAQQSNGKLIIVGQFDSASQFDGGSQSRYITRLNTDGTIDGTFTASSLNGDNSGYGPDDGVLDVKVLSDDRIVIGGYFNYYDGYTSNKIALLSSNGVLDESFSDSISFNGNVHCIELAENDTKLFIGGQFNNKIIKLNIDGTEDTGFSVGSGFGDSIGGNNPRVASIKVQNNSKVVVGHWFNSYDGVDCGKGLTRLNSDGTLDNTFYSELFDDDWSGTHDDDNDHRGGVNTIAIQNDGKIIAGGWFDNANGSWKNKIARINTDGSTDETFDVGFGFSWQGWNWGPRIQDVKIDSSGDIYVAGSFTDYNHAARFHYAKLDSNGVLLDWSVLPAFRQWGITDGMRDMYDSGNYINTNLTQPYSDIKCAGSGGEGNCSLQGNKSIPATHSQAWDDDPEGDFYDDNQPTELAKYRYLPVNDSKVMVGDGYFGDNSSYFTAMFPGMFVLAAKNINISEFSITGDIGTDGSGVDAAEIYPLNLGNSTYTVYFKSNYEGNDPSINHIMIVDGTNTGISHFYDDSSERDEHAIVGLEDKNILYYICISKGCTSDPNDTDCGNRMTPQEVTNVATKFLQILGGTTKTYQVSLTPENRFSIPNYAYTGEGNLDDILVDGKSIQRTSYLEIINSMGDRKVVEAKDGDIINDSVQNIIDRLPVDPN